MSGKVGAMSSVSMGWSLSFYTQMLMQVHGGNSIPKKTSIMVYIDDKFAVFLKQRFLSTAGICFVLFQLRSPNSKSSR